MKKKRKWIFVMVILLIVALVSIYSVPKLRVSLFVHSYHELIEDGLAAGNGVPADDAVLLGYDSVNSWEGEHLMTEFVIMSYGDNYYGCYYSPDDVPLAFQNIEVKLSQDGHDYWEWADDEENHGSTSKIMDNWYFFKASF